VSYDPRIRTSADYFELRVYRDDEYIKKLERKCGEFITDLKELLTKL
jgi:hypothetical protein